MSETHSSKILRLLKENGRWGVPNYKFPQNRILCYTKTISNLRKEGHHITGERQVVNGRYTGVWIYKLTPVKKPKYAKGNKIDGMSFELTKPGILNRIRRARHA